MEEGMTPASNSSTRSSAEESVEGCVEVGGVASSVEPEEDGRSIVGTDADVEPRMDEDGNVPDVLAAPRTNGLMSIPGAADPEVGSSAPVISSSSWLRNGMGLKMGVFA